MEIIERTLDNGIVIRFEVRTDILTVEQYGQIIDFLLEQESFREGFTFSQTRKAVLLDFDETQKSIIGNEDSDKVFNSIIEDTRKYEDLASFESSCISLYITFDTILLKVNGKRYCLEFIL